MLKKALTSLKPLQKLDAVVIRSNNNFSLVRLLTALSVIYAHSLELFKETHSLYVGGLRIHIFFFLSGLLITASFFHSKTYSSFVIMRLFRLWPAMIVCTLLTVFVLGPLVTALPWQQYFSHPLTWSYLLNNILIYAMQFRLPGVFTHNHYPDVVNGSIWTLKLELQCYVLIFLTGITGILRRRSLAACFYLIILLLYIFTSNRFKFAGISEYEFSLIIFFIAGSTLYLFKEYIYIDYRIFLALWAVVAVTFFVAYGSALFRYMAWAVLMYGVLTLGASRLFKSIKLPGDYSYGIFIYGFLIQQTLALYYPDMRSLVSLAVTIPIAVVLGALSWHFVENPLLKTGRKLSKRKELSFGNNVHNT